MRLVAVSIVKNEADIIEAFVRHAAAWVDHHLIFDHESTDGTRQILAGLVREGASITLFTDDAPGHLQQFRSNHLTRVAAESHDADWVVPLDADEFVIGADRAGLEHALAAAGDNLAANIPLLEYCPTEGDDGSVINPALRLHYCRAQFSPTRKLLIPRRLALDPSVSAGKGSHTLNRGSEVLPDRPLPDGFYLAHLALRSPEHQFLRVVRAELQRQSRGRAAAGLDLHYRLGYQLLAENPRLFFSTVEQSTENLTRRPIEYRGGPLRFTSPQAWERVIVALLPYLDQLAASHGRLADLAGVDPASPAGTGAVIRPLAPAELPLLPGTEIGPAFAGFSAESGWGPAEGPVPEAFLPPFHWGYAPATLLIVPAATAHEASLVAEGLTYSDGQSARFALNGVTLLEHHFARVNQKETLRVALPLRAGNNHLAIHYDRSLVTDFDSRQLAVIFLSLRITGRTAR